MGKIALVVVVIVYFLGLDFFNSQVAEACTHGNCVHGWDSKYTYTEQRFFQLWLIGFPILAYFIVYHFADEGDEIKSESNPKKSNLRSNKVQQNPKNVKTTYKPTTIRRIRDLIHGKRIPEETVSRNAISKCYKLKILKDGKLEWEEYEPDWMKDDSNKNE
jgi:hypothetical protein